MAAVIECGNFARSRLSMDGIVSPLIAFGVARRHVSCGICAQIGVDTGQLADMMAPHSTWTPDLELDKLLKSQEV